MSNAKKYNTTVYCGTVNGKVIRKYISASSSKELKRKVLKMKIELASGKDVYTNALFGVWADKWLNEYKIPSGIGNGTITQYKSAIKHLNRYFELTELKNINLSDFQQVINELAKNNPNTNKPMAKASLENIKKVGTDIFNYAIANNISGVTNFFKNVRIPKNATVNKRRALTEIEQDRIINTPHRCQSAAMIMMFSGLRRGELIPLLWSDVDLSNKIIYVNKSVEYIDNKPIVKSGGKTSNATRIVPIPPILTSYLKDYKKKSNLLSQLVCSNASGKMHTKSSFNKMWNSYLVDLNVKYGYEHQDVSKYDPNGLPMRIERFTPHYLRHTFATLLFLQDINVVTAKQYLGHADIQTTVNIYTDLEHNYLFNLSNSYKEKLDTIYKISTR